MYNKNGIDNQLYFDALNEIAECLGNSNTNPISVSLLCLNLGITNEQKGKIFVAFNQVLRKNSFQDLEVDLFRIEINNIVPESEKYAETVIIALIKAFARNLIPELIPFSKTL